MQISVIGTGYVGLVTGACLADVGNRVICVDVIAEKIESLKQGDLPFYEHGLDELVYRNYNSKNLEFTTNIKYAMKNSTVCFIAVGTPMGENGSADLQYVLEVAKEIGQYMEHSMYVINKSTVPVGTAELVKLKIQSELEKRQIKINFDVVSNPEFLKEGMACQDFLNPDRIIIGTENKIVSDVMKKLYQPFIKTIDTFIVMDVKSAELTKYAANSMLAAKISFINEIANICERVGADINKVRIGMGSDHRIGFDFISPGCGYGGSCFPKDVKALIKIGAEKGYSAQLLKSIEDVNNRQKIILVRKILDYFGSHLNGCKFAIWGLAFKPGTNDMRESPAIDIIKELTYCGAVVNVYDPKACSEAKEYYLRRYQNITYFDNKYDALVGVDAMVLVTEWKEFAYPDFEKMEKKMKNKIIFDGRNQYDMKKMHELGFKYYQIGVANS